MIIQAYRQFLQDIKEKVRYLKYKDALPKNPMHDDIYIVEFPKSGITWLQHIIGNIELELLERKEEEITYYNFHKYVPDIHQIRGANINRFLNRTFIKSHAEFNPYYYFVVLLIRNPFDSLVSYYNFMNGFSYNKSFKDFVKSKEYGISKWKSHINSWHYNKLSAQRIHFIKYEDLVNDAKSEIKKLYKNLGVDISDEIIDKSLIKSNINHMSELESHYKLYNYNYNLTFVGKENKKTKKELLNSEIERFIINEVSDELQFFYPELLKG